VLAALIRSGNGPAALVLAACDTTILVVGALVVAEMYGSEFPVVELDPQALAGLRSGALADVHAQPAPMDATVRLETP
jgi:predicted aconitase with swiveling domain